MKQIFTAKAQIPWYDSDGAKHWALFTMRGLRPICKRKIKRAARKYIELNFKWRVPTAWIEQHVTVTREAPKDFNAFVMEEFIKRMELQDGEADSQDTSTVQE